MPAALVDSNVLIAARIVTDQHHERATAIADAIDTGALPSGRLPNDALSEVLNFLHARTGHGVAVETLDALLAAADFELDRTTKSDTDSARSLFRRYDGLSFTDAVLVAYMRRVGIEYIYSFDDDFDAVPNITRLESTENPFS